MSQEERTEEDFYHFCTRWNREMLFFEENPELQYIEPYKSMIDDSTIKKSSKIMDAIYLIFDPKSSNQQSDRPEKEAKDEVARYFLKDELFNWNKYKKIIKAYKRDSRSPSERDYEFYRSKIEQIKEYLRTQPLAVNSAEITDLMSKVMEFMREANKFEKIVRAEKKDKRLRGGIHRSIVERVPPA